MKTVTITILGIDADGKTLKLSNDDVTGVHPGDTIQWIIDPGSGVAAITAIKDNVNVNIFKPNPAKDKDPKSSWSGTVNPKLAPLPCTEAYTIKFTPKGINEEYSFDPKIQVDS